MTLNITKEDVGTVFEDGYGNCWRMIAWNDRNPAYQVVCVDEDASHCARVFRADGFYVYEDGHSTLKRRVKPRLSGFVNVYKSSTGFHHASREDADNCAGDLRIACIDLSQFEEGHGL